MERYNNCTLVQRQILDRLYDYLGFNEACTFEEFINFIFFNARVTISYEAALNHTLAHIVMTFRKYNSNYQNYIKYMWIKSEDAIKHMTVGSDIEYDPKGLIRLFVKENFKLLVDTKV